MVNFLKEMEYFIVFFNNRAYIWQKIEFNETIISY